MVEHEREILTRGARRAFRQCARSLFGE